MADDQPEKIDPSEIDDLLKQAEQQVPASQQPGPADSEKLAMEPDEVDSLINPQAKRRKSKSARTGDDAQQLLQQAQEAIASVDHPNEDAPDGIQPFQLRDLTSSKASADRASLELLRDVELDLKIELGRTHMHLDQVLQLRRGSVVPLDKLAGDPVDVYVNGRLIARGEVLVLNDSFCVRVAQLISTEDAG